MFKLDKRLESDTILVKELESFQVRLMNAREYFWIVLKSLKCSMHFLHPRHSTHAAFWHCEIGARQALRSLLFVFACLRLYAFQTSPTRSRVYMVSSIARCVYKADTFFSRLGGCTVPAAPRNP